MTRVLPSGRIVLAEEPDFALGGTHVRPSRRQIVDRERTHSLEPRVMQVLVALARHRNDVVTRDTLVAQCWDGRIVGEDALNRCIAAVRKLAKSCGGFSLETIARVGYRLDVAGDTASVEVVAPHTRPIVAVLPFDSLSDEHELQFFSDGVSEEISVALMRASGLGVIGRTSAFQFRGARKADAGRALNVSHVLDGTVRRAGRHMRVTAQLSDAASGTAVWGDRYECDVADIFALQDSIADRVSTALQYALSRRRNARQIDPSAFELYLRGRQAARLQTGPDTRRGVSDLERSVQAAPDHARAWAALASARAARLGFARLDDQVAIADGVREAAARAIAIDADMGEPYAAQAAVLPDVGLWSEKAALLDTGLGVDPNDVALLERRARFKGSVGLICDAFPDRSLAYRLDPLSPQVFTGMAISLWLTGRPDEADALFRRGMELWPGDSWLWFYRYWALCNSERLAEAECHLASARPAVIDEAFVQRQQRVLRVLRNPSGSDADAWADGALSEAENNTPLALQSAIVLARIGRFDTAYQLAERQFGLFQPAAFWGPAPFVRVRPGATTVALFSPASQWLRRDPRFAVLCTKLGLGSYWRETGVWPDCADSGELNYDFRAVSAQAQDARR